MSFRVSSTVGFRPLTVFSLRVYLVLVSVRLWTRFESMLT